MSWVFVLVSWVFVTSEWRFESVGEDPGSTGRLTLWTGGVQVFTSHPLGVGLGKAVPQIERTI